MVYWSGSMNATVRGYAADFKLDRSVAPMTFA